MKIMKYNGWLIVENGKGFQAHGLVELPVSLTTIHKVIVLENETDYLNKCKELNIELIKEEL